MAFTHRHQTLLCLVIAVIGVIILSLRLDRVEWLSLYDPHTTSISLRNANDDIRHNASDEFPAGRTTERYTNLTLRSMRFPSVSERVRLYMSDWYNTPCPPEYTHFNYKYDHESRTHMVSKTDPAENDTATTYFNFSLSDTPIDIAFSLEIDTVSNCSRRSDGAMCVEYCIDVVNSLLPTLNDLTWNLSIESLLQGEVPVLLQFGDRHDSAEHGYLPVPLIMKFRSSMRPPTTTTPTEQGTSEEECFQSTISSSEQKLHPIIWKLQTDRHFSRLSKVAANDRSWNSKLPKAIFRGAMTGFHKTTEHNSSSTNDAEVEQCLAIPRCRLVYLHANSTLLDAALVNTFHIVPNITGGIQLVAPRETLKSLLKYKAMVFLEGNDVSSGLKWGLYSKSVVLMPIPTVTSWAMEELLEPWVHYVPILPDGSDVIEQIQWVLDHDDQAATISQRATLWMYDLVFHPDAASDDQAIYREILQRYRSHWKKRVS
jgi:hypothetical protein